MRIIKIKITTTTTTIIIIKKNLADHSNTYRSKVVAKIGGNKAVPNGEDLDPITGDVASQLHNEGGVGVGVI